MNYVLCRPQGGLNDILCQIERCCRYAEQFGRTVLVDTAFDGSDSFLDDFGRYFLSRQPRLVLSPQPLLSCLENESVYPAFLAGRLNSYSMTPAIPYQLRIESISRQPVCFDMRRAYREKILVHHQLGGGHLSMFALLRLHLAPELKNELLRRLASIGRKYVAMHVRHTDYFSEYDSLIYNVKKERVNDLFLATDRQSVLDEFRKILTETRVHNFASELSSDGSPLHLYTGKARAAGGYFDRNRDAIIDVIMLALSDQLLAAPLLGRVGADKAPQMSGFSRLALNLHSIKPLLQQFLAPFPLPIGLSAAYGD